MSERELYVGSLYKHFKGGEYRVLGVTSTHKTGSEVIKHVGQAIDEENRDVVYDVLQNTKGEYFIFSEDGKIIKTKYVYYVTETVHKSYYLRKYDIFLSKVDKKKYPEVEQEYRFELK